MNFTVIKRDKHPSPQSVAHHRPTNILSRGLRLAIFLEFELPLNPASHSQPENAVAVDLTVCFPREMAVKAILGDHMLAQC
eukprot:3932032-Rhodomonas_salina.1